ncbi:MAG TPA: protein translocase subunit SecD [Arenimonas sp.]|nr:protein translocase subunit SecD [Arenimonas sp.]
MLEFSRWKYTLIVIVLLFSALYSLPNVFPQDPSVQVAAAGKIPVDAALVTRVKTLLEAQKVPFKSVAIEGDNIMVRLSDNETQLKAADVLRPELGSEYNAAMNLTSTAPGWLGKIGAKPMTLGLDLRGGVHFLLQVDQVAAREKRIGIYAEEINTFLKDNEIPFSDVSNTANEIRVLFSDDAARTKALRSLKSQFPGLAIGNGADSVSLKATVTPAELNNIATDAIEKNMITIRNRMAALGEPIIQRQGNDRIIVELPGIQDTARAKELLGATATLEYRAVVPGDAYGAMNGGVAPLGSRVYLMRKQNPSDPDIPVLLSKRVIVSGDQLVNAAPTIDPKSGTPAVEIKLNSAGGKRMFNHTQRNVGKPMAVVYIERKPITRIVDGKQVRGSVTEEFVINTATINGTFSNAFITTGLDPTEAKKLSEQLKSGSLAAPVDIVAEQIIGPSLGAENVKRGVQAVVFSFAFVLVFFLIYYKMFGVITNVALLLQLLMVVAILSVFGATMTLPGFAGIALTVGMSVDANVLINERIREELRLGNTPLASIAAGYDKATGTIADANITALLAGIAMAVFGSGPISGFGITLIIGIVTSMYTAVAVSRGIATLIYGGRRKMTGLSI